MNCLTITDILTPIIIFSSKGQEYMLKLAKTSLIAVAVMATSVVASDILVTVNGHNITKKDAEAFVRATSPNTHYEQLTPQQKALVKKTLVEKALFAEVAKKEGIDKTLKGLKVTN